MFWLGFRAEFESRHEAAGRDPVQVEQGLTAGDALRY